MDQTIRDPVILGGLHQGPARPSFLVVEPTYFDVSYVINPWMEPGRWAADPAHHLAAAQSGAASLMAALRDAGAEVEIVDGVPGLPDLVFPANAGIVLDRRVLPARFAHAERRGEEAPYRAAFDTLVARGLLDEVGTLPEGCFQEGAGDCIWDVRRGFFWSGFGQRSAARAADEIAAYFGRTLQRLELVSPRFYHLDVCFCPLAGGEILYYPPAFAPAALSLIRDLVSPEDLIEATDEDAGRFCVNAVSLDRSVIMAKAAPHLKDRLAERGYTVREVDLSPFIMAGGGAYCMTLRLDRSTVAATIPV
jgi:N-dimethylarginine dimethylaminohydrolase